MSDSTCNFRHERSLAELDDLRSLLDAAAIALHHADYARATLLEGVRMFGRQVKVKRQPTLDEFNLRGRELDALSARLGVRLPRDAAVTQEFEHAVTSLLDIARNLAWIEDETTASWQAKYIEIEARSEAFEQHLCGFQAAAVSLAGSSAAAMRDD